jgi:hypothetical protein
VVPFRGALLDYICQVFDGGGFFTCRMKGDDEEISRRFDFAKFTLSRDNLFGESNPEPKAGR